MELRAHEWAAAVHGPIDHLSPFSVARMRVVGQFELCAALECADLSALWPKRCQGTALQGGAQFKLTRYPTNAFCSHARQKSDILSPPLIPITHLEVSSFQAPTTEETRAAAVFLIYKKAAML